MQILITNFLKWAIKKKEKKKQHLFAFKFYFMELNISNITLPDISNEIPFSISRSIRFILISLIDIPSTFCSIFILYHLLTKKTLRNALHNHMIILLLFTILIIQIIDMPLYLKYLYLGFVSPQTSSMCFFWWYIDIGFYDTIVILLAWTSFERHIFIFHRHIFLRKKTLYMFHYFPMIFFLFYPLIFYFFALLFASCDDKYLFDFTIGWCNYQPCYYQIRSLNLYDTLMNATIPCLLIALFSIILLLRVIWTNYTHFHQPIRWRKYRKMTIQVFLIALFFLLCNLPLLIYYLMQLCRSLPTDVNEQILPYFLFSANFSVLLLPFVIIFSLPKKLRKIQCQTVRQRQIHPNLI